MKRVFIALALLVVLFPTNANANSSKVSSRINPIASQTKNGQLSLGVFLGEDPGTGGRVQQQPIQVRVCSETECEIYISMSGNSWEGYSSHLWRWTSLDIATKFKDRPITAQVPIDLLNGENGWSRTSNTVTISSSVTFDPMAFYRKQATRPLLEIVYSAIDPTGMKRVDLCLNYREGMKIEINEYANNSIGFDLDVSAYPDIRYELYENGRLKQTRKFDTVSPYGHKPSIPGCDTGTLGSFLLTAIDNMRPGQTYKLTYTLSGHSTDDLITSLDFVTPGGCPTGEVILAPSPRTFHYGIINEAGILVSYQFGHRSGEDLPSWLAPIFHSGSKVIPFNGNLYEIRTSNEKWRFLSGVDEWALVLDDATTQAPSDMLAHTVFADCRAAQVTTKLSLDESTLSAAEQGCAVLNNKIVPVRPGICMIEASITSRRVKSSAAKSTKPTLISMNYVISKVAKSKKLRNNAVVTMKSKTSRGSIVTSTSLLSPSKGARVVRITTRTSSVCRPQGTSLHMLKKGKCRYTATVVRKGKSSTISSVIRVS